MYFIPFPFLKGTKLRRKGKHNLNSSAINMSKKIEDFYIQCLILAY